MKIYEVKRKPQGWKHPGADYSMKSLPSQDEGLITENQMELWGRTDKS